MKRLIIILLLLPTIIWGQNESMDSATLAAFMHNSDSVKQANSFTHDVNKQMISAIISLNKRAPASVGGGGVAWGAITGTLSSQTDLQTALNAKAPAITVGTYVQRRALTPSDGDQFFQTNDGRNGPAGKYYYLNGIWNLEPQAPEMFWWYFNDFSGTSQTNAINPFMNLNNEVSGTGATISFTTGNSFFSGLLSTGTATNGYVKINAGQTSSQNAGLRASTNNMYYQITIASVSQKSNLSDVFNIDAGFTNGGTGNPQGSGYYFRYDSTTSANWLYRNGAGSLTSTGVAFAATTPYVLEVFVRSDSVFYWINNVSIAAEATGGNTSFYTPYTRIIKTSGTTAVTMNVDYIKVWARLQSSRTVY